MILQIFVRIRALRANLFLKEDFLLIYTRLLRNIEFATVSYLIWSHSCPLTLEGHSVCNIKPTRVE